MIGILTFLAIGGFIFWIVMSILDLTHSLDLKMAMEKWNFFKITAKPFMFIVQQTKSFVNLLNLSEIEKEIREKEREIEELKRQKENMKRLKKLEREREELFKEVEVE